MKTSKQVVTRIVLIVAMLVSLVACGDDSGTLGTSTTPAVADVSNDAGPSIVGDLGNSGGSSALFAGELVAPIKNTMTITRGYGALANFGGAVMRHLGVDIDAVTGDAIYAPVTGKIADMLYIAGYGSDNIVNGESAMRKGWIILVQASANPTSYVVLLGHVTPDSSLHVGDSVVTGQRLGTIARYDHVVKGAVVADWAHLHIGVRSGTYPTGGLYYLGYNKYGEDIVEYEGKWNNPLTFTPVSITSIDQTISVTAPTANATLIQGTPYSVSWNSSGVTSGVRVHLYYNGAFYQTLSASSPNSGSISFTPPATMPTGGDYSIGVSSLDNKAFDFTSGFFSIAAVPAPVVTPPVVSPEMNSANYVTIYRFNDLTTGARCYGTSTSAPADCSGFSYEREAFIIGRINLAGTFPLAQCSKGTDHILVDMNSSDYVSLTTNKGYKADQLGHAFVSSSVPTSYPFSHVCGVARYSYDTSDGGSHLFTLGADSLTDMNLEAPNPSFLAMTNSTSCSNVLR